MVRKLILVSLFAALFISINSCSNPDTKAEETETKIPVETMSANLGQVVQSLSYYGDINAEFEVKVFSKIPDRIEKFFVDDGDKVSPGATIAKIYASTIEQAVLQAKAGLVAAQAQEANLRVEFERATRLQSENAMSKQQYDAIETQYEAAKAQVNQAEAILASSKSQLKDASVTAPIKGIIGKRYYETGDMASPALPLVSIVQMDRVKLTFDATEEDLGKLAIGQQATIMVKSYPDKSFKGKIIKISPILDPLTRMVEVEVLIDNPQHKLKPGMYAEILVTTGILDNFIVIPRYATLENITVESSEGKDVLSKNYYVYIIKDGKAEQRKLQVEYVNHENIAVKNGLEISEQIVISGQNNLRDGIAVTIANEEASTL